MHKIESLSAHVSTIDQTTYFVVLLSDHTIWWINSTAATSGKSSAWVQIPQTGLPSKAACMWSYYKPEKDGNRILVVCYDCSLWYYCPTLPNFGWQKSKCVGLPNLEPQILSVYEKFGDKDPTTFALVMADNSIWQSEGTNWVKQNNTGLPKSNIDLFSTYCKPESGGSRYVVHLADGTTWWCVPNSGAWTKVKSDGLPSIKVVQLVTYVKPEANGTRYLVLLSNNKLFYLSPGFPTQNWIESPTTGLPIVN